MNGKKSFTLAEVLITLGIIGVVAALTIPALVKNYREKVLVNKLKRDYALFSQVVKDIYNDYEGNLTIATFYDSMTSKIKTAKTCRRTSGCFESTPVKYLHLSYPSSGNWNNNSTYKFVMHTGEFVLVSAECANDSTCGDLYTNGKPDYSIYVDINGINPPNTIGRDVFVFGIKEGCVIPQGYETDSIRCGTKRNNDWGYDCAWKVIKEGKFTY